MALRKSAWVVLASAIVLAVTSLTALGGVAWAALAPGEADWDGEGVVSHVGSTVCAAAEANLPAGNRSPAGSEVIAMQSMAEVTTPGNGVQTPETDPKTTVEETPATTETSEVQTLRSPLVAASADPETTTYVDVNTYADLSAAIMAANDNPGSVIRLSDNLTVDTAIGVVNNGYDVTIDFNGKTLTYNSPTDNETMAQPFIGASTNGILTLLGNGGSLIVTNNAAIAVYENGIVNIVGLQIVNSDHVGVYGAGETGQINVTNSIIEADQAIASATDVTVTNSTITSTGDGAYGIDACGTLVLDGGSVTGKAGGINVQWGATINSGSVSGENGAPAIVVTTEPGEEAPATAINGGIFSSNPTGLDGVTIANGKTVAKVTEGTNADMYRLAPIDMTDTGWDLSAISGDKTADGSAYPAADATISFSWDDGTNDVVTLPQTGVGSTEDGFYVTWTKQDGSSISGASTQGLLSTMAVGGRPTEPGAYAGAIRGTGAFSDMEGSVTMTLTAQGGGDESDWPMQMMNCTITVPDAPYTGLPVEPQVTVTSPAEGVLTEGVDYWLEFYFNIRPGWGSVEVHGVGKYYSSKTQLFKIVAPSETDEPGMWGSCAWELSADGTLTVHAGTGRNTAGKSPWKDIAASVKRVVFEPGVVAPTDCSKLLRGFKALEAVDFSGFYASAVCCMDDMFFSCGNLTTVDLSRCGAPKPASMNSMFNGCAKLTSVDFGHIDTSGVNDMAHLFSNCKSLEALDLTAFDTSGVRQFFGMFDRCSSLGTIYVSGKWTTSNARQNNAQSPFKDNVPLVGNWGTAFDASQVELDRARPDSKGAPGYLTLVDNDGKVDASRAKVSAPAKVATGAALSPNETVTVGAVTLERGKDYEVVNLRDNVKAGTAKFDVMFKGRYKGSAAGTFVITAAEAKSGSGAGEGSGGGVDPGASSDSSSSPAVDDATPKGAEEVATLAMRRLYNPYSYEHFYTANEDECANLVSLGWLDEGVGWVAPATSDVPVYRLYNPYNGGDHHYTKNAEERDTLVAAGWVDEDVGWYSADDTGVPVYREYNPNELARNHNYTKDKDEHDGLVAIGWHDEEIAWYGV